MFIYMIDNKQFDPVSILFLSVNSTGSNKSGSSESALSAQETIHGSQVVAVGTPLPTASLPLGAQQGPVMVSVGKFSPSTVT